ncbi:hypothetical protein ITJ66_17980 [Plantibacter sp. VKM Ac-2885]|uniref:hypothetical protein n=1 Tax=Plantibacter sp. VKM Ac-2885 TaxID=2783828 RepID=UPI00188BD6B3|nr:hypothetical protein [Plantibacter sp. VKM Ac-2885]MBF4514380.1 hypothetical protein [Plantibacter sp. VKM Ac-2885]
MFTALRRTTPRASRPLPWPGGIWISIVAWAALVTFALLSVGPPLLGMGTFLGTDLLQNAAPWQSALGPTRPVVNALVGDTVDTVVPQTWAIVDMLRAGTSPAWNPWVGGGTELGGLPNSGLYSPLSVAWWVLPLSAAPGVTKLLEIVAVTIGMSLFLRRLRLPDPAWALASLVFVSSGFMVSWTNWQHTRVAAVIPLLFWALDRAAVRRRLVDVVPVAIVVGVMLLGGFPAVTAYALYAGAVWVVFRAITTGRSFGRVVGAGAVCAAGVVLGVALCAWTMVPFAINATSVLDFSVRAQSSTDSLQLIDLVSAFVPEIIGDVSIPTAYGSGSPIERLSYVGIVAMLLIASRFLLRRSSVAMPGARFQIIALAVCVVLVYIGGPALAAAQELPVFSNNPIGRLRVLVGFFSATLAAAGFAALIAEARPPRDVLELPAARGALDGRQLTLRILTALAILGLMASLTATAMDEVPAWAEGGIIAAIWTTAGFGAAGLALILLGRFAKPSVVRAAAVGLLPLLVLIPALDLVDHWWGWSDESTLYPATETTDYLAQHLGEQRFANTDAVLLPGANTIYGLRSVGGHAYQTAQWQDLLREVDPNTMISPTYSTFLSSIAAINIASPVLDRLGVSYMLFDPNAPAPGVFQGVDRSSETVELGDGPVRSTVRTGPVRTIGFAIDGDASIGDGAELTADIVDEVSGDVLASTTTWYRSLSGERNVTLAGEPIPAGTAWHAEIRLSSGSAQVFAAVDDPAAAAVALTLPAEDGARIVQTGEATIIERTNALPRVRWADSAIVETDADRRLSLLAEGAIPPTTVLLERDEDLETAVPAEEDVGSSATVDLAPTEDDPAAVSARTTSDRAGWLVIDDSLRRPGWSATIDGEPAALVPAEHAGAAVRVPAGTHDVRVQYTVPGLETGTLVSLAALGVTVLLIAAELLIARRHQRRR